MLQLLCTPRISTARLPLRRASSGGAARASPAAPAASPATPLAPLDLPTGYRVLQDEFVPERSVRVTRLLHEATGAEHVHFGAPWDANQCFGVSFRTTPSDSTGIAHVLEHTVLCGSKQFPVRDPFFLMLKRSLANFMNAMTYPDMTLYPFATTNATDFDNLLRVYTDATFFPLLDRYAFLQEGVRLQPVDASVPARAADAVDGIESSGVVLNEMRGAMSDASSYYSQRLQSEILASTPYVHNSGGDPVHIPELTYEALCAFHQSRYHPSNACFATYGSMELRTVLNRINELVLSKFERLTPAALAARSAAVTRVPSAQRLTAPRYVECTGPAPAAGAEEVDDEEDGNHADATAPEQVGAGVGAAATTPANSPTSTAAMAWLLPELETNAYLSLKMSMFGSLLLDGPSAPFYDLLESQLGKQFSPSTGLEANYKEAVFSVGLTGVRPENVPKVYALIEARLQHVAEHGFGELGSQRLEATLHQFELSMKQVKPKFGLSLVTHAALLWVNDGELVASLQTDQLIARLRAELAERGQDLWKDLVKEHLINNTHRVSITMHADLGHAAAVKAQELEVLRRAVTTLSQQQRRKLADEAAELQRRQLQPPDASCLPALSLSELSPKVRIDPLQHERVPVAGSKPGSDAGVDLQWCAQPTNDLVYLRLLIDAKACIPAELQSLVPLYCHLATRMGAGALDYREFDLRSSMYTGGVSLAPQLARSPVDPAAFEASVQVGSMFFTHNTTPALELLHSVLKAPRFDDFERFKQLIMAYAYDVQDQLMQSGHSYAVVAAHAALGHPYALHAEKWRGLEQVRMLQKLAVADDKTLAEALNSLAQVGNLLRNEARAARAAVNAPEAALPQLAPAVRSFLSELLPVSPSAAAMVPEAQLAATGAPAWTHVTLPSASVSHVGLVRRGVVYTHADYVPLEIAAEALFTHLHGAIRERGGAYGARASNGDGVFSSISYRDPYPAQSVQTLLNAGKEYLIAQADQALNAGALDEARLSLFQGLDAPLAPGRRGLAYFNHRITDAMRQAHRDAVFRVSCDDVLRATERHLGDDRSQVAVCVLGPAPDAAGAATFDVVRRL